MSCSGIKTFAGAKVRKNFDIRKYLKIFFVKINLLGIKSLINKRN